MTIEIHGPTGRAPAEVTDARTGVANKTQNHGNKTDGVSPASSSTDRLSLTDTATVIKSLEHQVANLPVIDSKRVSEVQHTMTTGELRINPESVAEKMLRFEAGMPG